MTVTVTLGVTDCAGSKPAEPLGCDGVTHTARDVCSEIVLKLFQPVTLVWPSTSLRKVQLFLRQPELLRRFGQVRTENMEEERRLVWRVLRHWQKFVDGGRFPRRDEIDLWLHGEDGKNCLLIAVESPIELSHFIVVGLNLAVALCSTDTLAGLLLARVPRVASARRGLTIEGGATLRGADILYRSVLLPLSEDGVTVNHVLGATNYRLLREDKPRLRHGIFQTQWI